MVPTFVAIAAAVLAVAHLVHMARRRQAFAKQSRAQAFEAVASVIAEARDVSTETVGVDTWAGRWNGQRVQIRTIVDTLAVRKLPTMWLSVTITEPVAVPGTIDVMQRPAGPTSFSNFDHLPETLPTPPDWPDEAVVRTDDPDALGVLRAIEADVGFLAEPRIKELLITPNGVRLVCLVAEADRARYGVLRQASFGDYGGLDPMLINRLLGYVDRVRGIVNSRISEAA